MRGRSRSTASGLLQMVLVQYEAVRAAYMPSVLLGHSYLGSYAHTGLPVLSRAWGGGDDAASDRARHPSHHQIRLAPPSITRPTLPARLPARSALAVPSSTKRPPQLQAG